MINHRKRFTSLLTTMLLCIILSLALNISYIVTDNATLVFATTREDTQDLESLQNASNQDTRYIYDEAGLMTDKEITDLEQLSGEYGKIAGIEIFILTHDDPNSTYPERYVEDFEDQLPMGDRVYFLYDVSREEIFMEGYGLAETYIHSKRIDKIFDNVVDDLKKGYYYDAFETYIIMSANYMTDESELNYDHDYYYDSPPEDFDPDNEYSYDEYDYDKYYDNEAKGENILLNVWFQLFISLLIGGVVVGLLAYNSSGRMTAGSRDYLDRSNSGLVGRRDHYIRSTVTRVRKPTQNNSSGSSRGGFNAGGFRGGSSSGGRSHSSGGRKL